MAESAFKSFSLISKGLGIAIVTGSIFVKVPQIIKILNAKSGQGISMVGLTMELFSIVSNMSYNFVNGYPFSAYGDGFFLFLQTTLIGSMVLHYTGAKREAIIFLLVVVSAAVLLCSGLVPISLLWSLQAANIPIAFSAKMVQAFANYQNGSTGQLSAITVVLLFFGSTARIFTSIQETGDAVIIAAYCAGTLANMVILAQLIMYWNVSSTKTRVTKSKKKQ